MSDIADKIYAATGLTLNAEAAAKVAHMIRLARQEAADEIEKLREALRGLIEYVEKEQCDHLTLRRGTFWTFCDNCGGKWASDEWDFRPPKKELKEVATARATLGEKG